MSNAQFHFKARGHQFHRGFTLIEILLSVFILGIGMIMVASVFPVGANWTRQATEESVGQAIAQNAISVLQAHYGPGGDLHDYLLPDYSARPGNPNTILKNTTDKPFKLQALPGFTADNQGVGGGPATDENNTALPLQGKTVPLYERAYQFGSTNPFPAANPASCTYFWTVLARLNPAQRIVNMSTNDIYPAKSYKYDIYILVFRKGDPSHAFLGSPKEVLGTRAVGEFLFPSVWHDVYKNGAYDVTLNPPVVGAVPPMGDIGIGRESGTVFRQSYDAQNINGGAAIPRPSLIVAPTPEEIIYAPGPTIPGSNTASPLIYVYQTTMQF